jgi:hypothetical protein
MRGKRAIAAGVTALFALALAAYALAAREAGTVASYTGCLKNGKIESVALGDAPLAPCGTGQTQVRLSGGDITAVGAGGGLTGGGDGGDVALAVDPSAVQSRVVGSCLSNRLGPIDASISAIHQDGTVICNTDDAGSGPDVFAGFYDGPVAMPLLQGPGPFPIEPVPIARLALPAGKYAITATIDVGTETPSDFGDVVICALHAGDDFDRTLARLDRFNEPGSRARLTLEVVHEFGGQGVAEMRCGHGLALTADQWSFLKITATRVANLTNGPLELVSP